MFTVETIGDTHRGIIGTVLLGVGDGIQVGVTQAGMVPDFR